MTPKNQKLPQVWQFSTTEEINERSRTRMP